MTTTMDSLRSVDITPFIADPSSAAAKAACADLVTILKQTSCIIVHDPRVREQDNETFLDMMEQYFSQPSNQLMKDVREEMSYQIGATPEFTEVPRDHTDIISHLPPKSAAHVPKGPDPKWRFFWRIGERPKVTKFPEQNGAPVIPANFPNWATVMNKWGELMLQTLQTVAQMIAVGYNLPIDTFTDLIHQGPHLLAPTGSDLMRFHDLDTVFAGFHYDFNLLTIHGKSRFPGLYIWLRDGTKIPVKVPTGALLIQAGKQLEWLTGGQITAGFHEVVVAAETLAAIERAKAENRPLWRISSTLFCHVNSDKTLKVLPPFESSEATKNYPPTLAGKQSEDELAAIALSAKK